MIKLIQRFLYKRFVLKDLSRSAWKMQLQADYDAEMLDQHMQLLQAQAEKAAELDVEIGKLADSHTREDREKRQQMEKELIAAQEQMMSLGKLADQVKLNINNNRQRAAENWNRYYWTKRNFKIYEW